MAEKDIKVRFLSEEEAAKIEKSGLVPVYRVRYGQRRFMCWAKRDDDLWGAVEIRVKGDKAGGTETEIEYLKSDS
jgi:uncharacterized protein YfaA (DUF2138 family)